VNVLQVLTLDRGVLTERVKPLPPARVDQVDSGLRLALAL
jgi:mRNA-degrading endonuclease toxin of MazEF toxin-antitoxin module